jgi:hypothetical protein
MRAVLLGIGLMLLALVVEGLAATFAVEAMNALLMRRVVGTGIWRNLLGTLLVLVSLLTGHLAQVAAWAAAFMGVGEFDTFAVAFYHSAVNYTTLGYGDIVMSPRWRLLGPLEAVSGTLAFGWSTAAIVTVVIRLVRYRQRAEASSKRHAAS